MKIFYHYPHHKTTHFSIKFTASNFSVRRKQIQSTLIRFDIDKFIDGSLSKHVQFLDTKTRETNHAFLPWYHRDQITLCVMFLSLVVAPIKIASEALEYLTASNVSSSWSRIISLRPSTKNPRGNLFVTNIQSNSNGLVLAQNAIDEEDLQVRILNQLGDEFNLIVAGCNALFQIVSITGWWSRIG